MAAVGDSSYYAGALIEQIEADALVHLGRMSVIRPLVNNKGYPRADQATFTVWNRGTNTLTSGDVGTHTEGSDASDTKLDSDKKTATLDMYSFALPIEDEAKYSNAGSPMEQMSRLAAKVTRDKHDALLAAQFDNFTTSVGTSTVAITIDNLWDAVATLEDNGVPGIKNAVLAPKQIYGTYGLSNDLVTSTQFGGTPGKADEMLNNGFVNSIAGVNVYASAELTTANSATKGGVFVSDALGFGYVNEALLKMEMRRPGLELADVIVVSTFCGVVLIDAGYGVEIWTKTA